MPYCYVVGQKTVPSKRSFLVGLVSDVDEGEPSPEIHVQHQTKNNCDFPLEKKASTSSVTWFDQRKL